MEKSTYEVTNENGEREIRHSYTKRKRPTNWALLLAILAIVLSVLGLIL